MFVDASAMCAILLSEADEGALSVKLAAASRRLTSPIAVFETVRAVMREARLDAVSARSKVARFVSAAEIETVPVGAAEREIALDAMERFGKGRHAARLNMGDCFAYACARAHGLPLFFTGDDFSRTDIETA